MSDDFGPNGGQIRALFDRLASLDAEGWFGLTLASKMLTANPRAATPEYRSMVEQIQGGVRVAAEITNRVRSNAMKSGEWSEIEASVISTSGPIVSLAMDVAARFNPGATQAQLAEAVTTYSDPISGLTHALRLRPYISDDEFTLLWGRYEMSWSGLAEIRESLPLIEPSGTTQLGITARSGGCLIAAAAAIFVVCLQLL